MASVCVSFRAAVVAVATVGLLAAGAAPAAAIPWDVGGAIPPSRTPAPDRPDPECGQSYANDAPLAVAPRMRFGVGPRLAGEGGAGNATPLVGEDAGKRDAALRELKGDRFLAVRLNRLFMADGSRGIARFKALADRFARLDLDVELQVRYHPRPADDGDIGKWLAFVRKVVRSFGPNEHVTGLQITNEVNLRVSPNTSDGFYRRSARALVSGVIAAKRESLRRGYRHQRIGFNYAWRFGDRNDAGFWNAVGRLGGARLRRATDWVGIDIYPGTFVPTLPQVVHLGDAFLEGLAQMRECYMPKAGFTRATPLRIEETGFPTGPGRPGEQTQARAVAQLVKTAVAFRGTYAISDFRFFGLRDNNSMGPDFQSFFGLLRDDYSRKPAFGAYRDLIAHYGAPDRLLTGPGRPRCPGGTRRSTRAACAARASTSASAARPRRVRR